MKIIKVKDQNLYLSREQRALINNENKMTNEELAKHVFDTPKRQKMAEEWDLFEIKQTAEKLSERMLVEAYDIIDDILQKKFGRRLHQ